MKATINIQEDEALRKAIREMIKGQVVAITREEIRVMIIQTIAPSAKKLDEASINKMIKDEIQLFIKYAVNETSYTNDLKKLDKMIRIEIANYLEKMKPRITRMVSEAVRVYIDELTDEKISEEIENRVNAKIASMLTGARKK